MANAGYPVSPDLPGIDRPDLVDELLRTRHDWSFGDDDLRAGLRATAIPSTWVRTAQRPSPSSKLVGPPSPGRGSWSTC
ncbi:hypothetical protein [Pseudonocardia thermophila]|jgi:hypothetical protein|uniref:hypothetical protein n=1 Tax=Pseudonocardia thermophila TaxID=1848 RepID=UPI00093757A9|nr:hypothetical protein [Pseudonocardia thermophila]